MQSRMGRKKGRATSSDQPEKAGMVVARALFADVMHGSVNTHVDPRSCIPLTQIRSVSRSGVLRLKRIFRGSVSSHEEPTVGFVAGSDMPIVVPLEGALSRHIVDHFRQDKGMTEDGAREEAKSRSTWYGVVDGFHRLLAILDLVRENPESWDGFLWPVLLLKGGPSLQVLKQLARHQNRKLSEQQYVETTLYDQLSGLKLESERLRRERGKPPTAREVAAEYEGCSSLMDTTIQQMATTAMRLSNEVVSALGSIMNSEHPELIEKANKENNDVHEDSTEVMSAVDCRVFRRFLNISSIKQATVFMRADGKAGIQTQKNTLLRCRDICRASGFKSVSYRIVVQQFQNAALALKECQKFETLIESDRWPVEMETMHKNILETTKFDEDIARNAGNDTEVLQSLIDKYKLTCPAVSSVKIQKHRALQQNADDLSFEHRANVERSEPEMPPNGSEQQNGSEQEALKSSIDGPSRRNETAAGAAPDDAEEMVPVLPNQDFLDSPSKVVCTARKSCEQSMETPPIHSQIRKNIYSDVDIADVAACTQASQRLQLSAPSEDGDLVLKALNIECHQMKWQDYDKTVLSQDDSVFDLVLSDPPYGVGPNPARAGTKYKNYVDDQEMREFSQFCRRVLLPGGYVFLFTSAKYFNSWCEALRDASFKVCQYPFVLSKNTTGLQGIRLEDFPQSATEFSVMARAPGKSSSSFKPNFESPFHLFECPQKRRFASVLNAPIPRRKLTDGDSRAPLLTEEKNPDVLGEIMTTFCPEGGRVLDCYAGTCTTAIACMKTDRRCVCVEMNADIYRYALRRLQTLAPTYYNKFKKVAVSSTDVAGGNQEESPEKSVTRFNESSGNGKVGNESRDPLLNVIKGGDEVQLMVDDKIIGFAIVQSESGQSGGKLKRSIHNQQLSNFQEQGQDLVSVLRVSIRYGFQNLPYPYSFPTQDDLPKTLGNLHPSGVYVWDSNKMVLR